MSSTWTSPRSSSAVADTDLAVIADASDSFATKRVSLATLGTHFGTGGGGGGTDDQTAAEVPYTSDAGGNLPATITEVQAALDAIDSFELENTFRGAYDSNRTYDGGEMVIYQGLEYISLIRNNTREPTRSEEQWSAQPRGYIFRGDAPVASTTYQQSHMVRVPSENSWYMATLQGGAQATRAQIPTHTDFQPFTNQLTDANVANASASIKGTISGEQLHDFAPELGIAEATSKVSDEFGQGIRPPHRRGHRRARGSLDERDHGHRRRVGHRDEPGAIPATITLTGCPSTTRLISTRPMSLPSTSRT